MLIDNPVVTKELRSRMRGGRAYWVLFVYLLVLSITVYLFYESWWRSNGSATMGQGAAFIAGRQLFTIVFALQAVLISLIMPALTSGGISIEREQRTFELLQSTTITPRAIVLGKLFSSLSFVGLLLTASLPLVAVCFMLGGVAPDQVIVAYLLLLLDAAVYGAVALAWSAATGGTGTATAMAYGSLFMYFIATIPFALGPVSRLVGAGMATSLSALNPIGAIVGTGAETYYAWSLPAWVPAVLINSLLGGLMVVLTTARLSDDPARGARMVRRTLLGLIVCALFFIDGMSSLVSSPQMADFVALTAGLIGLVIFLPPFVTGEADPERNQPKIGTDTALFALILTAFTAGSTSISDLLWNRAFHDSYLAMEAIVVAYATYAAVVFAMAATGHLLSIALRNRWVAMIMLYVVAILGMAIPLIVAVNTDTSSHIATLGDNWLYLCPFAGYWQLGNGATGMASLPGQRYLLWNGSVQDWVVTAGLYATIGVAAMAVSRLVAARRERQAFAVEAARS